MKNKPIQHPVDEEHAAFEKLQNLIDAMPDMIFVMYRDGTILEIHGEDPGKLIAPADQLIGTSIKDLFEEEEFVRHIKMYEQCLAGKETGTIVFYLNINNQKLFFESRIKPLRDGRLLTIVRDITLQKQLKEAHNDELAYRKFLFQNDCNGLVILNCDHKVVDVNAQFCQMTGYSIEEIKAMYAWDFDALLAPKDIVEKLHSSRDMNLTFASRHRRKDGSTYEVEVSVASFYWKEEWFVYCACKDIDDRVVAAKQLSASEEQYRMLFNANRDSIFVFHLDESGTPSCFVEVNEAAVRSIGYEKDELLQMNPVQLEVDTPEELRDKRIVNMMQTGHVSFETIVRHKSGRRVAMDVKAILIDYNNRPAVLNISRDISQRKSAENELLNAKASLTALVENTMDSIWSINSKYEISYINEKFFNAFRETFGVTLNPGNNLLQSLPTSIQPKWKALYDRVLGGERVLFEDVVKGADETVYIEVSANPIVQKETVVGVSCFGRNITARKQAEEAVQRSNQRLEALLEISRQTTSTTDQKKIMQLVIDNALKMVGLDTGAVYFKSDESTIRLSATSPELPKDFPEDLRNARVLDHPHIGKALQTGNYVLIEDTSSADMTPKEREVADMRRLKTNLYLPVKIRGKAIGVLILSTTERTYVFTQEELDLLQGFANQAAHIIDHVGSYMELKRYALELEEQIQFRQKVECELIQAKEKAQESDRLKSAFLANMSHEIRTPMNGILGFAHLLKNANLSSKQQHRYIEIIEKGGMRMLNIINDIVDVSRIETGVMDVHLAESSINESLDYLYRFFGPQVEEKRMQLVLSKTLPADQDMVITDREKLLAVLTNLIKNSIKFTNEGIIKYGCINKGEKMEFFVSDTGIGIPQNRFKAIFDRFVQADIEDKEAREGAGLGLAISKSYVEMLGGEIWVESEEGRGSTFYFTITCNPPRL